MIVQDFTNVHIQTQPQTCNKLLELNTNKLYIDTRVVAHFV